MRTAASSKTNGVIVPFIPTLHSDQHCISQSLLTTTQCRQMRSNKRRGKAKGRRGGQVRFQELHSGDCRKSTQRQREKPGTPCVGADFKSWEDERERDDMSKQRGMPRLSGCRIETLQPRTASALSSSSPSLSPPASWRQGFGKGTDGDPYLSTSFVERRADRGNTLTVNLPPC